MSTSEQHNSSPYMESMGVREPTLPSSAGEFPCTVAPSSTYSSNVSLSPMVQEAGWMGAKGKGQGGLYGGSPGAGSGWVAVWAVLMTAANMLLLAVLLANLGSRGSGQACVCPCEWPSQSSGAGPQDAVEHLDPGLALAVGASQDAVDPGTPDPGTGANQASSSASPSALPEGSAGGETPAETASAEVPEGRGRREAAEGSARGEVLEESGRREAAEGRGSERGEVPEEEKSGRECTTPAYPVTGPHSAWHYLKRIPPPAECRVQGFVIERLEPEYNFRRPYALGLAAPTDKTHMLPYLRGFQDLTMSTRRRRVLLDLGGNYFNTSTLWFLRNYPLHFTEVHVFEALKGLFRLPERGGGIMHGLLESLNWKSQVPWAGSLPVPAWALKRIRLHEGCLVGAKDVEPTGTSPRVVNITRFIKDTLNLTRDDAMVVKMDIEMAEWAVLRGWLEDREMPFIVDELFVEVHYRHRTMARFGWNRGPSREKATELLVQLRSKGFFVHAWP